MSWANSRILQPSSRTGPAVKGIACNHPPAGFTLIEVLVVVGLVTLLTSILLPSVGAARAAARATQCASNLHQLTTAFFQYAAVSNGKFPPNVSAPAPGMCWYDDARIGQYVPSSRPLVPAGKYGGNVYICPEDPSPALLCYSMNIWASSAVDSSVLVSPVSETLWRNNSIRSSQLMLLVESYSQTGSATAGWYAPATVGATGISGAARFGANGGLAPPLNAKRWGYVTSELDFLRHRTAANGGTYTQPKGRLNVAYADGHVAMKTNLDLIDRNGNLTGDSFWSAMDWGGG